MKTIKSILTIAVTASFMLSSCNSEEEQLPKDETQTLSKNDLTFNFKTAKSIQGKGINKTLVVAEDINTKLKDYGIAQIEIYNQAHNLADKDVLTVIPIIDASNEYRTGFRFIPNDPRREGRDNLTYVVVSEFATSPSGIPSEQIFDDMYDVWENASVCNNVAIDKQAFSLATDGFPSTILNLGDGVSSPVADHNVIGYIPAFIFDLIGASSTNTLAVNFSFGFRDENGNFTDINGDGKIDLSHTETWFNDNVNWSADGLAPGSVDIASVALHEFGHSLGLGHSGVLIASVNENGQPDGDFLQFSPVNVMNPSYIGNPKRDLAGDDNSIYCEQFSAWPWY
ncbi:matrixin family metalloprotease [Tenacibaculum sp. M341]|uniref:matrixin family metalloprotease n=1 Tax=Tenacibaculum sp. M341 TaxID=2530339 RepID=UPI00104CEEA8|nr:matrixin family metalloprotease [Tenacibaculum sp. M341]TCI93788.1 matrixin family metalloprotease [Tenacibaculum sp. M341]